MKFFIPLFAASAAASSFGTFTFQKRQASTIEAAVAAISSSTSALNTAVQAFSGAGDVASLQASANSVLAAINSANSQVSGSATLTEAEAAPLAGPIGALATLVQTTVNNVIAKKSAFVAAGAGNAVYQTLLQQQSAAATFTQTTLSKIPASLQGLGQQLAQPIADALAQGVAQFQDQAGAGGSTTMGGSTTTGGAVPTSGASTTTGGAPGNTVITSGMAPTSKPAGTTSWQVWAPASSTTGPIGKYTGAAVANAVNGFGAAAAAAIAAAAML